MERTQTIEQNQEVQEKPEESINDFFSPKDVLDAIGKQGREMPIGKKYDPALFWDDLGEDYLKRFKKRENLYINVPWLMDRIKMLNVKTLLDAGTGFGRVLPFFLEEKIIETAAGFDVAPRILKTAEEYLKPLEPTEEDKKNPDYKQPPDFRSKIEFFQADIKKIPRDSETYDVVLTSEILQHLPPADAEKAIQECVRVARKAVIMVERWAFPSEHAEPHLWSHDIAQILKGLGMNVTQVTTIGPGLQGIVALKRRLE